MSFLRDPAWSFVAVVIAIVAVGIGWWQRKRKVLSCHVLSHGPIVMVSHAANNVVTEAVKILYNGKPVRDVQLVEVRIWNSGNVPIVENDYREPIVIRFGGEMLASDVVEAMPSTLKQDAIGGGSSGPSHSKLGLRPILLNQKDSLTVQALLTNFNGDVHVDTRIVGIPAIRRVDKPQPTVFSVAPATIVFLCGVALALFGRTLAPPFPSSLVISIGGSLMGAAAAYLVEALNPVRRAKRPW